MSARFPTLLTAAALSAMLAGCATTGHSGLHKPRCANPDKVWVEEETVATSLPSSRRIGGMMGTRVHYEVIEGHWHYLCEEPQ